MAVDRLAELLKGIFSSQNETRVQCELQLIATRNSAPEQLVLGLLNLVRQDHDLSIRKLAAVLLRQIFTPFSSLCAWERLSSQVKDKAKEELLAALEDESAQGVKANICEAITEMMLMAVKESDCQAILNLLFEWVQTGKGQLVICALTVLDRLCLLHADEVASRKLEVAKTITWSLQTDNNDLKQISIRVFCACVSAIESSEVIFFRGLLQPVLRSVVTLLESSEEQANQALNKLTELAESEPHFFAGQLRLLLELVTFVYHKEGLTFEIKLLTIDFVVTLLEKLEISEDRLSLGRGLNTMVLRLMTTITYCDDDVWAVEEEDESDVKLLNCTKTISRIVEFTEELDSVTDFVRAALNEANWKSLQAGFLTLSAITQFVYDKTALNSVMGMLSTYTAPEAHPRIKYAAVHFVWQLCDEAEEIFAKTYAAQIIPVLLRTCQDSVFRVVSISVKAVMRFVEVSPPALIMGHFAEFLQKLIPLLASSSGNLVENVLVAISAIAVVSPVQIANIQQVLIENLFNVLRTFKAPSTV
mmetsp:Transcript_19941/g.36877  ORF Transcript_19941/g.36877 Transcript_19941/m.36877 type:complete len:532 (+) Transcript_19941:1064-2659(+)